MKSLQQIADELSVSKSLIYYRLKVSQISLTDLTGKKVKNKRLFDEDAETIIKGLFVKDLSNNDELSKQSKQSKQYDELVKQLEEARANLAVARAEIERLHTVEEQQQKQIADLIEIQKAEKMLLLQQQTNIKMLEAPKPGLLTRVKRFVFGDKKESSL